MSEIHAEQSIAYVRTKDAPTLPAPPSEVGIVGWLWRNMFSSMANFSTPGAALQSIGMIILTATVFYLGVTSIWYLIDFALVQAVWSDPQEELRLACATVNQGGALPADWYGACWPYIDAKWKSLIYGRFPDDALWRPNLVFLGLAFGLTWLARGAVPSRRVAGGLSLAVTAVLLAPIVVGDESLNSFGAILFAVIGLVLLLAPASGGDKVVGQFMLGVFPILSLILLTGGDFNVALTSLIILCALAAVFCGLGHSGKRGVFGAVGEALGGTIFSFGVIFAYLVLAVGVSMVDFGLEAVPTSDWGGLLVTLVVALTGIVASLPLGILLALGRRSSLPAIRLISMIFIEFWRGVPLVTVLFMSSVMLPLFLPEGADFDKLLRALIGVALFSAAYMAEVVRGGLQAIPKGQYEGAMAMGLPFWRMMNLIILPQALTLVIPGIVNTFIGLFKDTTLVLIIGLFDLLGAVRITFSDASWSTPVQAMTGYLVAASIFGIFCFAMSRYSMHMERKLRRGHAR